MWAAGRLCTLNRDFRWLQGRQTACALARKRYKIIVEYSTIALCVSGDGPSFGLFGSVVFVEQGALIGCAARLDVLSDALGVGRWPVLSQRCNIHGRALRNRTEKPLVSIFQKDALE